MKKRMTELRATRTARGLTLKELAAKVSMSYSRIQQLDAGDWDLSTARPITQLFISGALKDRKFQLWPEQDRADLRRLRTAWTRDELAFNERRKAGIVWGETWEAVRIHQ